MMTEEGFPYLSSLFFTNNTTNTNSTNSTTTSCSIQNDPFNDMDHHFLSTFLGEEDMGYHSFPTPTSTSLNPNPSTNPSPNMRAFNENQHLGGAPMTMANLGMEYNFQRPAPFQPLSSLPTTSPSSLITTSLPQDSWSNGQSIIKRNNKKGVEKVGQPRVAFQIRSEMDILDDGYKWRKYGQKALKHNKSPRSYYRCTHSKCNVKKRVERSKEDPGIVVITYHGVHNHYTHEISSYLDSLLFTHPGFKHLQIPPSFA